MSKDQTRDQRPLEASPVVAKARALAAAGQHAAVVEFLGSREQSELEDPTLALLYGIAQARLGRHEQGLQWIDQALAAARQRREHGVERHALNARGAIALVSGNRPEAADFCTRALMAASRDGDHATTGRASNNLGIISHLRGRHAEAISSWEIAAAAFHRAGMQTGVADCQHNLANAYREQNAFDKALATADQAVAAAEATRDEALYAMTLRGRAEIRAVRSEPELARRDLDRIRVIRSQLPDPVAEAEDLRIQALVLAAENHLPRAEKALREVIGRAELHERLLLQGEATRDLAVVLQLRARSLKDRMMEVRALNVCGAIALERGGIDEATYFFTRAQEEATDDNDMATVGRCANNLGVIANMQGDYKRAVVAYTRAIAAYEQAHFARGVAESRHNLGIVCRAQGRLDRAVEIANVAIEEAQRLADQQLTAQAIAGLAEIHVARGEADLALETIERALVTHRELKDPVREAEDLRIKAGALALKANGNREAAQTMLRQVIERATEH